MQAFEFKTDSQGLMSGLKNCQIELTFIVHMAFVHTYEPNYWADSRAMIDVFHKWGLESHIGTCVFEQWPQAQMSILVTVMIAKAIQHIATCLRTLRMWELHDRIWTSIKPYFLQGLVIANNDEGSVKRHYSCPILVNFSTNTETQLHMDPQYYCRL